MPTFTILVPHKRDPENNKALAIALSCIAENTVNNYELIVDSTTPADPYAVLNRMAMRASGEYIVFLNSDTFVAPGWDVDLLAQARPDTIVNLTLVEPGAIGVYEGNFTRNFGMTPASFDRAAFEAFAAAPDGAYPSGNGFVFYGLLPRKQFLARGGFDLLLGGYPLDLDRKFWLAWEADDLPIVRSKGLIYHLQNFSNVDEQTKVVRHVGSG